MKLLRHTTHRLILSAINGMEALIKGSEMGQVDQLHFEEILKKDLMTLRYYPPLDNIDIPLGKESIPVVKKQKKIPLVLIPPLMAPAFSFDLFPNRSLVKYFLSQGFKVYLIDWGSPDRDHSHLSFEAYILDWMPAALSQVKTHSTESELSLFGYCMGGLFTIMYAAVTQDPGVRNIITVASPIDTHQMGAIGKVFSFAWRPASILSKLFKVHLKDIDHKYFYIPGWLGTIGFHITNPIGTVTSYWDLLLNLYDREYVTTHESMEAWINNLLDYPGATFKALIEDLFLKNKLYRGKMKIDEQNVKTQNIRSAILAFAGQNDRIVPAKSVKKILSIVASHDKSFFIVPGGHVGVICGSKSVSNLWQMSARWLNSRSN